MTWSEYWHHIVILFLEFENFILVFKISNVTKMVFMSLFR